MAGYKEAEIAKLDEMLAELSEEELKGVAMEAARLLRSEREWREAGCPKLETFSINSSGKKQLPKSGSASRNAKL